MIEPISNAGLTNNIVTYIGSGLITGRNSDLDLALGNVDGDVNRTRSENGALIAREHDVNEGYVKMGRQAVRGAWSTPCVL